MCVSSCHTMEPPAHRSPPSYWATDGLVTLGPALREASDLLDSQWVRWARDLGAEDWRFPPLLRSEDLAAVDYFRNFPHLGVAVSPLRPEEHATYASGRPLHGGLPSSHLADSHFLLPSAACFNVYFHLQNQTLERTTWLTTRAACFRNESRFRDLRRLWGFTMRELVVVGRPEDFLPTLDQLRQQILDWAEALGLQLRVETASDPFFDPSTSRAKAQVLFPVKEEMVFGDGLAIASINRHRNFFGERCAIRLQEGEVSHTACVAFGLERWLYALLQRFDGDPEAVIEALRKAAS